MPIIPLIRTSPLANLPSPVLDNQRRPTVDASQEIAAVGRLGAIKAPEVPTTLAAPYEALGSVGRGIQQAGGVLGQLAQKQQQAQTDVQTAEADNTMLGERASFDAWKTENPDPSSWGQEWGKRMDALKTKVLANPKLTSDATDQINLRLTRFQGQSAADVLTSAAKETFSQAKNAFTATVLNATDAQDQGRFDEALKTGADRGYFWPHEVEAAKQNFAKVGEQKKKEAEAAAYDQAESGAVALAEGKGEAEAVAEIDKGTLGNFDDATKERLRNRARLVSQQRGAEATDMLVNGVLAGQLNSDAAIDAVDNPHLTPKLREEAKQWLQRRDVAAEKDDKEKNGVQNAVAIRQQIEDYDPAKDPDRTSFFSLKQAIGASVEPSMAGELTKDLNDKYGINAQVKLRPEIQREASQAIKAAFDPRDGPYAWKVKEFTTVKHTSDDHPLFGAPAYKAGDPVIDPKTGKAKIVTDKNGNQAFTWVDDPAKRDRATVLQAKAEKWMQEWYKANPDKRDNPTEVNKAVHQALPEGTRGAVMDLLQKKITPPTSAASGPVGNDVVDMVKGLEGFTPKAYGDYKQVSVGYGTRAKSHDETLTEPQADARLRDELSMHAGRIDQAAQKVGAQLTPAQRNALISFDFNTGQGAELLQSSGGKLDDVKRRMLLYTHAGGHELPGLVARRQKEASLFNL